MVKPFMVKPFPVTALGLAMAVSAFLAVGAMAALADENKLLNIEPLSSDELLAEKGEGLGGGLQTAVDDPLRRRGTNFRIAIEGGRNTVALNSGRSGQINSTSLRAVNNLVNISNIAGGAGGS